MSAWLEAYEQLPPDVRDRVQHWIHLQKFIAQTLKIPWEKWVDHYLAGAMDRPFDYSFMQGTFPQFGGFEGVEGRGVQFSKDVDPATALVARVPVRAQNSMGRLSPDLQDKLGQLMESGESNAGKILPADLVHLQKIFRGEKALSKLKRKDFRKVSVDRDGDDIVLQVEEGDELLRMNVMEFAATMSKALV